MRAIGPGRFFVVIALLFGTIFAIANPPFFGLDERAHYMRSYLVSQGHPMPGRIGSDHHVGAYIPRSVAALVRTSVKDIVDNNEGVNILRRHDTDPRMYGKFYHQDFRGSKVDDPGINGQLLASYAYSPFGYLHFALGVKAAQVLDLSLMHTMYLLRFIGLFLYVAIVYAAIRVLARYGWLIAIIALLPAALFQATVISLDSLVTACSLLLCAIGIRCWLAKKGDKPVSARIGVAIAALVAAIALTKMPYVLLAGIVIFLPANRFASRRIAYIWKSAWLLIAAICVLGWIYVNRGITPELAILQPHGQTSLALQLHGVLHNPLRFLLVLFNTYFNTVDTVSAGALGKIGDRYIGLQVTWMYLAVILSAGVMAAVYCGRQAVFDVPKNLHILLVLLVLATVCAISGTLYLTYTPVGAAAIDGIQGRYFLPLFLPLLFILANRLPSKYAIRERVGVPIAQASTVTFLLLTALLYIVVNY
jgi:uncharacterized membrane protein